MQTLSSASRTCMASASAVECTATVAMPSSLHARSTRKAISPRLAIRILSNMRPPPGGNSDRRFWPQTGRPYSLLTLRHSRVASLDDHERLAVFDRLTVLDQDLGHRARTWRGNLIHRLHRFDNDQRLARLDLAPDLDEGPRAGGRADIGRADHRRRDDAGMLRRVDGGSGLDRRHDRGRRRAADRQFPGPPTRRHMHISGDPDRHAVALELDLGEPGFIEQLCQLADHGVIDRRRLRHQPAPGLTRHDQSFARPGVAAVIAARPAMASAYPSMPKPQMTARAARDI